MSAAEVLVSEVASLVMRAVELEAELAAVTAERDSACKDWATERAENARLRAAIAPTAENLTMLAKTICENGGSELCYRDAALAAYTAIAARAGVKL